MSDFSEDSFSFSTYKQRFEKGYQVSSYDSNVINRITKDIVKVPPIGSQDFSLKLSDDSTVEDTQDVLTDNVGMGDVIVISDSSSDCRSNYLNKQKLTTPVIPKNTDKSLVRSKNYILEISDDSDEDEKFYETWKNVTTRNKHINKFSADIQKSVPQDKNSFFTSDDSSNNSSVSSSEYNRNTNVSKNAYVSPLLSTPQCKDEKSNKQVQQTLSEKRQNMHTPVLSSTRKLISNNSNSTDSRSISSSSKKPKTFMQLKKADINKILRNIKSTKAVYESPKAKEISNAIIDETLDDEMHPALSSDDSIIKRCNNPAAKIIDETSSNLDIAGNQYPRKNELTSSKLNNKSCDTPIDDEVKGLSERKKKEISHWLMANSPGSHSDSSFTNVPASSRNSISSGNSSLERLERNYETPNNRGKLKSKATENKVTLLNVNKEIGNSVSKLKTQHKSVHKSSDGVSKSSNVVEKEKSNDQHKNVDNKQSNSINVMQCTDILDKLYGNVWRDKADALLSTPTEKQQNVIKKHRAVQTERKETTRYKHHLIKPGEKHYKPNTDQKPRLNSVNSKQSKYIKRRNSFINDSSCTDSESDSLYQTALTTPRPSHTVPRKPLTISSSAQRVIAICDSDTEHEESDTNSYPNVDRVLDKKKLSFSDEESSSGTSEFDPGDDIPQKRVHKKDIGRTIKNSTTLRNKYFATSTESKKKETHRSFLASLSDSVPITSAHPDAKKYRLAYKNNKEELCKYLYKLYNEKVFDRQLPEDMTIEWNIRMRGTAGYCYNKKSIKPLGSILRSSRIVLSTKILDTPDRLRDTLIHEMCHAAAWLINDISDGHGPFWTAWTNKAMKVFPELPPIRRCHDYKIKTKFTYRCISCGYSIGRHSKSLDIEKKRCGHCYGKFELLVNRITKSGTVQMNTPKREPSAFALYVKENYSTVKKDKNLKHAEVMKLLGQQFSAIKITKNDDNNVINNKESCD